MEAGLVKVTLGGYLGRKFGKEWNLHVRSPAEAVEAIDANTKGEFRRFLYKQGNSKFYRVSIGRKGNDLEQKELANPSGKNDIFILPVIRGKKSGIGKILAAVAIAALVVWNPASLFLVKGGLTAWGTAAVTAAASLAIGGVIQLITPVPNFNQSPSEDSSRGSNIFAGNASSVSQGEAVPLVYGRALVSPMPISISFQAVDQSNVGAASYDTQEYDVEYGPGGVINYVPRALDPNGNLPAN